MFKRISPILAIAGAVAAMVTALVTAPAAAALPQCTNTNPTTTLCERPGNSQLNTTPQNYGYNGLYPWFPWGWGSGGIAIGIGGI